MLSIYSTYDKHQHIHNIYQMISILFIRKTGARVHQCTYFANCNVNVYVAFDVDFHGFQYVVERAIAIGVWLGKMMDFLSSILLNIHLTYETLRQQEINTLKNGKKTKIINSQLAHENVYDMTI